MAESRFKLPWPKFGPNKIRENNAAVESGINRSTPKEGFGITLSQEENGLYISISEDVAAAIGLSGDQSGGASGTPIALYGVYNGAPALFHLLQSSAPTPL